MAVFLLTTKNAFDPVKRVYSVNIYIREFQLSHEGMSKVSERAGERGAYRSGALRSEWVKWVVRVSECSKRPSGPFKTRYLLPYCRTILSAFGLLFFLCVSVHVCMRAWVLHNFHSQQLIFCFPDRTFVKICLCVKQQRLSSTIRDWEKLFVIMGIGKAPLKLTSIMIHKFITKIKDGIHHP